MASARASACSSVWPWAIQATPKLAVMRMSSGSALKPIRRSWVWMRRVIHCAASGSACGSRATNSSPPKRATRSCWRVLRSSRRAKRCSTSSPAAWPQPSLTRLKWSRSHTSTAADSCGCSASRRCTASLKARRFSSPVSGSRSRSSCSSCTVSRTAAARKSMANSRPNTSRLSCSAIHEEEMPSHSPAALADTEAARGVTHSVRTKKLSAKTTNTHSSSRSQPVQGCLRGSRHSGRASCRPRPKLSTCWRAWASGTAQA